MTMTQCEMLVEWFEEHGAITASEAMRELGIGRLAARVSDLRRMGYDITSELVSERNRYGKLVTFARYRWGAND